MSSKPTNAKADKLRNLPARKLEEDSIRVRAVIDSMAEGLIVTDESGHITAINPYALTALGYEEAELLGKWFSGAIIAVDENCQVLDAFSRPIIRALTSGQPISENTYYLRKDGSMMPIFLTVSPVVISGKPSGAIELFRDTTIEKQLDIAKDEFVSLASHQLRTPASGVEAVLSMVLAGDLGPLNPQQHKYLIKAAQSNNRQLQIIEDILNAAQIDAGKMELNVGEYNLAELLRQVASEHKPVCQRRNQTLKLHLPQRLSIWGDKDKMRMVFDNLVSNASKYTADGQIYISANGEGETAVVEIIDTGVGIDQKDMPRLFTKFARFDNPLSTLAGGSGVGLYLVKNIVNLHRGDIIVESKPGEGSTFRVILPVK